MSSQHEQTRWEKTKSTSKAGFDWAWKKLDKLGAPVNRLSNKLGSEAFWPTDIGRESDKAARILRSFCKDGFYEDLDKEEAETVKDATQTVEVRGKQRVIKKIPQKVINNAVGLCIFTTMRTGLWISGAGGSGVLVAKLPDGSWSPPSGVLLHTAGLGFLVGVDIYDCVVVINTHEALRAFENPRFTLGGEISAVAGPVGMGGVLESELHKRQAPVWNYIKSRGFYAGVQIDGTVIIERNDENVVFYGEKISTKDILAGKVRHPPHEIRTLIETIKAAEGSAHDESLLPGADDAPPGDYTLTEPDSAGAKPDPGFGVPQPDDPDPFGVRALQDTGLEIHEAGTGEKPPQEEFEFHPSPTSPVYAASVDNSAPNSASLDGVMMRNRASTMGGDELDEAAIGKGRSTAKEQHKDDGDIGASGADHVRMAAEISAKEEKGKNELASPGVEDKKDPIEEASKRLEQANLGETEDKGEVKLTGVINAKGEEIVEERTAQGVPDSKVSQVEDSKTETVNTKNDAPPELPPR